MQLTKRGGLADTRARREKEPARVSSLKRVSQLNAGVGRTLIGVSGMARRAKTPGLPASKVPKPGPATTSAHDRHGRPVRVGTRVRVIEIADSLRDRLASNEWSELQTMLAKSSRCTKSTNTAGPGSRSSGSPRVATAITATASHWPPMRWRSCRAVPTAQPNKEMNRTSHGANRGSPAYLSVLDGRP